MLLSVARVSKLFGVEGGVLLNLYTTFPDDFSTEEPLFVKIDSLAVPLFCDRFERRGKTNALATFADIDSARRAEEFIGRELYLEHEDDENDEFYLEDLIGFRVRIGTLKGEITDITTARPILSSRWRSAANGSWFRRSRSSSQASISRAVR